MRRPPSDAPHVRAAIERGLGQAGAARGEASPGSPLQAKIGVPARDHSGSGHSGAGHSSHVQAAIQRGLGGPPSTPGSVQAAQAAPSAPARASHVRTAIETGRSASVQAHLGQLMPDGPARKDLSRSAAVQASASSFITYTDLKSPTSPPPPPRLPVYSLRCADGGDCSLQDLKTGRTRPAGDLYAGYVRISPGGPVYISPRPDVGLQGDSHPSIASVTPEERGGRGAIIAAGEVGFINSQIIGHNDKTGHYRTRRNYWQSGMPPEKYHSFTEDPHDWYKALPDRRKKATEEKA